MKYDFYFNRMRNIAYIFSFDAQERKIYDLYFEYLPVYEISVATLKMVENRRAADKCSSAHVLLHALNNIGITKQVRNDMEIFEEAIRINPYSFKEIYQQECLNILYNAKSIMRIVQKLEYQIIKIQKKALELSNIDVQSDFWRIIEENIGYDINEFHTAKGTEYDYEINMPMKNNKLEDLYEKFFIKKNAIFLEQEDNELHKKFEILESIIDDINNLRNIQLVCQDICKEAIIKNIEQMDRTEDIVKNGLKQIDREEMERIYCVSKMLEQEINDIIQDGKSFLESYNMDTSLYTTGTQADTPLIEFQQLGTHKLFDILHDMNNIKLNLYVDMDNPSMDKFKMRGLEFAGIEFIHKLYDFLDMGMNEYNVIHTQLFELSDTNNIQHNKLHWLDYVGDIRRDKFYSIDTANQDISNLSHGYTEPSNNNTTFYKLKQLDTSVNENNIYSKSLLEISNNDNILYKIRFSEMGNNDSFFIDNMFLEEHGINGNVFNPKFTDSYLSDLSIKQRSSSVDQIGDINIIKTYSLKEQVPEEISYLSLFKSLDNGYMENQRFKILKYVNTENMDVNEYFSTSAEKLNKDFDEIPQLNVNTNVSELNFANIIYSEFSDLNIQSVKRNDISIDNNDIFHYTIQQLEKDEKNLEIEENTFINGGINDITISSIIGLDTDGKEFDSINAVITYSGLTESLCNKINYLENLDKDFFIHIDIAASVGYSEVERNIVYINEAIDGNFYINEDFHLYFVNNEISKLRLTLTDKEDNKLSLLDADFVSYNQSEIITNEYNLVDQDDKLFNVYDIKVSDNYSMDGNKYSLYVLSTTDKMLYENYNQYINYSNQDSIYYSFFTLEDTYKDMDSRYSDTISINKYEGNNLINKFLHTDDKDFYMIFDNFTSYGDKISVHVNSYKHTILLDKMLGDYDIDFITIESYNITVLSQDNIETSIKDFQQLDDSNVSLFKIEVNVENIFNIIEQDEKRLYEENLINTTKFPQEIIKFYSQQVLQENKDFVEQDITYTAKQDIELYRNNYCNVIIDIRDFSIFDIDSVINYGNEAFENKLYSFEIQEKSFNNETDILSIQAINNEININTNKSFTFIDKDFILANEQLVNIANNSIFNLGKYIGYETIDKNFGYFDQSFASIVNNNINIISITDIELSQKNMFDIDGNTINNVNIDVLNFDHKSIYHGDKLFDEIPIKSLNEGNVDIYLISILDTEKISKEYEDADITVINTSYINTDISKLSSVEKSSKLFDISEIVSTSISEQDIGIDTGYKTISIIDKEFDSIFTNILSSSPNESNIFLLSHIEKTNKLFDDQSVNFLNMNSKETNILYNYIVENLSKEFNETKLFITSTADVEANLKTGYYVIQKDKMLEAKEIHFINGANIDTSKSMNKNMEIANRLLEDNDFYYLNSERIEFNILSHQFIQKDAKLFDDYGFNIIQSGKSDLSINKYFILSKDVKNIHDIDNKYVATGYKELYQLKVNIYDKTSRDFEDFNINIISTDKQNSNIIGKITTLYKKEKDFSADYIIINTDIVKEEVLIYLHNDIMKIDKEFEEYHTNTFDMNSMEIKLDTILNIEISNKQFDEKGLNYVSLNTQDVSTIISMNFIDKVKDFDEIDGDKNVSTDKIDSYSIKFDGVNKLKEFDTEQDNLYTKINSQEIEKMSTLYFMDKEIRQYDEYTAELVYESKLNILIYDLDKNMEKIDKDFILSDISSLTEEAQNLSNVSSVYLENLKADFDDFVISNLYQDSQEILCFAVQNNLEQINKQFDEYNVHVHSSDKLDLFNIGITLLEKNNKLLQDMGQEYLSINKNEAYALHYSSLTTKSEKILDETTLQFFNTDRLDMLLNKIQNLSIDKKEFNEYYNKYQQTGSIEQFKYDLYLCEKRIKDFEDFEIPNVITDKQIIDIHQDYFGVDMPNKLLDDYDITLSTDMANIEIDKNEISYLEKGSKILDENIDEYLNDSSMEIIDSNYYHKIEKNPKNLEEFNELSVNTNYIEIDENFTVPLFIVKKEKEFSIDELLNLYQKNYEILYNPIPSLVEKTKKELEDVDLDDGLKLLSSETHKYLFNNIIKTTKVFEEYVIKHYKDTSAEISYNIFKILEKGKKIFDEIETYLCDDSLIDISIFNIGYIEKSKKTFDSIDFDIINTDKAELVINNLYWTDKLNKEFEEKVQQITSIKSSEVDQFDRFNIEKTEKLLDTLDLSITNTSPYNINQHNIINLFSEAKDFDEYDGSVMNIGIQDTIQYNYTNIEANDKSLNEINDYVVSVGTLNILDKSILLVDDKDKDFDEFNIISVYGDKLDLINDTGIKLIESKNKELTDLDIDLHGYINGLEIDNHSLEDLLEISDRQIYDGESDNYLSDDRKTEINFPGSIGADKHVEKKAKELDVIEDDLLSAAYEEILTDSNVKYFYSFVEEIIKQHYDKFLEEIDGFIDFNDSLDKDTNAEPLEVKSECPKHLEEDDGKIDINDNEVENTVNVSIIEIEQFYSSRNDLEETINLIDLNDNLDEGVNNVFVEIQNYFTSDDFLEELGGIIDIHDNADDNISSGNLEIHQYYTSKNDLEDFSKQQIDIQDNLDDGLSSGLIEINDYFTSEDFLEESGSLIDFSDLIDGGLSSGSIEININSFDQLENSSENEILGFKKNQLSSGDSEINILGRNDAVEEDFITNDNEFQEDIPDFLSKEKIEILYSGLKKSVEEFIYEEFTDGGFIKPVDKNAMEILNRKLKLHVSDTSQEIESHNGDRVETGKRGFDFRLKDYWSQDWVWLTARKSAIAELVELREKVIDDFQNNLKLVLNSNISSFPSKGQFINEIVYMWMKNTEYNITYVDEIELLSRALMHNIKDDLFYDKAQVDYIIDRISKRYHKQFVEGFLSLTLYEGHIEARIRLKAMLNFYMFLEQLIHVNRGYLSIVSTQEGIELITKILRKWIETETNELTEEDIKNLGNHEKLIELFENSLPIDYEYLVRWFEWYCDQEIFLNGHDFEKNAYESLCNIRDRMISYFNTHWGLRKTNYTEAIEKYDAEEDLLSYVLRPEIIVDKSIVDKIRGDKHGRLSRVLSHLVDKRGQSSLKGWKYSGGGQYMIDYDPDNPTGDFNIGGTRRSNMKDFYHIDLHDLVDTHEPPHVKIDELTDGNPHDLIYKISEIEVYKEE